MVKTVEDYTAILSGSNLNGDPQASGKPVYVTYSFDDEPDEAAQNTLPSSFLNSFSPFTSQEREAASSALHQWDEASGVTFLPVAPGEGQIRFGNYDFSQDPDEASAAGFAYYPNLSIGKDYTYDDPIGSDVFIDGSVKGYDSSDMEHVILHEIGHALGFKHPFEGDPVIDPSLDNTYETVMSYNGYSPDLGVLDKQAIAFLYGPASSDGSQDARSNWDADTETLTQVGGTGDDVMVGVSTSDIMRGKGGDDLLFGGSGGDILNGGTGSDTLFGGSGGDRFVFNSPLSSSGIDTIQDFTVGDDLISLSGKFFSGLQKGQLDDDSFIDGPRANSSQPSVIYDQRTGALSFDQDGKGTEYAAQQFAQLQRGLDLSAADFRVF